VGVVIDQLSWLASALELRGETLIGQVILTAAAAALIAGVCAHVAISRTSSASPARLIALGPALVLVPVVLAAVGKLAWEAR